ncbi:PAS domain S-box protein [Ideonella sp. BN130291]|uniref:PAS domain S-box protein n=1 Tax=Ideonella sp. BN130291 TaxID=3112940 RepID=UPI002E26FC8F|nr:PAS domain S-box protein [Ideonella sp. BN130291]
MALVVCVGLLVPAALVGVLLIGVHQPAAVAERQQQEMDARLDLLARGLSELMWGLDEVSARELVQAAMRSPDMVSVQVTDRAQSRPFVTLEQRERRIGRLHSGERDIERQGQVLGRLRIEINDSAAAAALSQQRWLYAWTVGGQVLVSLLLLLALLHSRVARPLGELGRFANELADGRFSAVLRRRRDDEIGRLGERLEHMRDALQHLFDEQRHTLERLRQEEASTDRLSRFYAALSRSNQLILREHHPEALYAEICRICVETGHARMACLWLLDEQSERPVIVGSVGPVREMFAGIDLGPHSSVADAGIPLALALFAGRHGVSNDYLADPHTVPMHERALAHGVRACAAFPVRRGGRVAGALSLYASETGVFDDGVIELLDELAADLSFALDNFDRDAARVAAQREVEAGFRRFSRLFGAMPMPVVVGALDDGTVVEINAAACERFGHGRAELLGRRLSDLGVGMSEAERARLIAKVNSDGMARDFDTRLRVRSGELRDVLINAEPIEFGGRACALTIVSDITERKRMERALRESEGRLSSIIETALDAIVSVDAQQRIVVFNRAATQMFRIAATQALGGSLDRFIPPSLRAAHRAHVAAYAVSGESARRMGEARRLAGLRADGEEFPIEASISRSGEGEDLLMTVVARDTTRALEAERARQAQLAAEAASRAKTEFLSRMSHELRTPLNAVLGFSQLLQSGLRDRISEREQEQLDTIRQAGWHLLALINDVLDVSRIESGRLQVQTCAIDLRALLDEALQLLRVQAESNGVTLEPAYRQQPAAAVWGDPVRVRQVMLNVIGNAVKYNRAGGTVRVQVVGEPGRVRVDVVDTGLGMTRDQLAHLFEPFNRLGRERGGIEGSGIGMALTRQLMELMHGAIQVESEVGVGTTVRLHLPVPAVDGEAGTLAPADDPASAPQPAGLVLYIEDNPVNLLIVEEMLGRWPQVRFAQATDGARGIALARELQPDLVLLDMRLPDMDGVEVMAALHTHPATRSLRVVVLSAGAQPEDAELAKRCGALDYWTKPLDLERFMADMQRLLATRVGAA